MTEYKLEVALSFAGEDREFVRKVAELLQAEDVSVFYDESESIPLWGKDLAVELAQVYGKRARFVVVFVSESYAKKAWPRHEFRSALAAAIESEGERILPVRLDDTKLPGLRSTVAYLPGHTLGPDGIARAIVQKLRLSQSEQGSAAGTEGQQASASRVGGHTLEGDLAHRILGRGYWLTEILPLQVKENRLKISPGLVQLVRQQSVSLRGWDFPHVDLNTRPQIEIDSIGQDTQWEHFHELWRLFKSGKFLHLAGMRHDWGAGVQLGVLERPAPVQTY